MDDEDFLDELPPSGTCRRPRISARRW